MAGIVAEQGSLEWKKQRAGKINASNCAAFEGMHKFSSSSDVVRDSVRELSGAESEFKGNQFTEWGKKHEPLAIERFERLTGLVVEQTGSIAHADYPFLRASPDGLIGLDACIEIKCPYNGQGKGKTYSITDPDKTMYLWQIRMQLEVLDLEVCHYFCYVGEDVWKHEQVKRGTYFDHELQADVNWLDQRVSGSLLPQPRDGDVRRVDLFQAWHNFIHSEHQDPELRKKYLDPKDHCRRVDGDSSLDELYQKVKRQVALEAEIEAKAGDEMSGLATINKEIADLKTKLKKTYDNNVTNGKLQVHISVNKPSFDFKSAFEAIGGKKRIKELGLEEKKFNKQSVKQVTKILLEETTNG